MKPYVPVEPHVIERIEIAILTTERLDLHWADENTQQAYMSRVDPLEVIDVEGRHYLRARNDEGAEIRIRLDLIRNLPTPVK